MYQRETTNHRVQIRKHSVKIFMLIAFLFPFAIYLITLNPSIGFIDNGELVTVCRTLGIAHPTGYPLYTLLGRIITLAPIKTIAFRVNMLSALFSSLASFFLFLFLLKKTNNVFLSLTGAVIFSCSRIVWHQSTSAEVYSITFFFLTLLLYLEASDLKNKLLLIGFVAGLSVTNHMIIITFLAPFFIYLLLTREFKNLKTILVFLLFFLIGITLYLYLPIRGTLQPLLNWGRPVSFERFLWHVSGKQYRVWMFTGDISTIKTNILTFLKLTCSQFTPVLIVFAIPGIYHLFAISKKRAVFLLSLFLVNGSYAVNYDIPDIEPYFIITILVYTIFIIYGICFFSKRIKWIAFASPILAIFVILFNFHNANERQNHIAYDMCRNLFFSVKENGIVITNDWDYYSPALYIRYIEGKRNDIVMIDKELLRRSWYFDYLNKAYPWLIEKSQSEVEAYLELLVHFEHDQLLNPDEIQRRFIVMINSFIDENIAERPCYITFVNGADRDASSIATQYQKTPFGIVYEISHVPDTTYFDYAQFTLQGVFTTHPYKNKRTLTKLNNYPNMSLKRALYLLQINKFHSSIKTAAFSEKWDETKVSSIAFQAVSYLFLDQYEKAISFFKRAYAIEPQDAMLEHAIKMLESNNVSKLKQEFTSLLGINQDYTKLQK